MGFFKKDSEEKTYFSEAVSNDGDDSSPFHGDDNDDNDNCYFEIDFFKELSNGALVFKLIDDDDEQAGHVVVSSKGTATIIENTLSYNLDDDDRECLKAQAEKFYNAM